MRKAFLGSLSSLLASASLAFAQPPANVQQPAGSAPAVLPPASVQQPSGGAPAVLPPATAATPAAAQPLVLEQPRSPYWPNPAGLLECAGPGNCATPAITSGPIGHEVSAGELFWVNADYLLWWVRKSPLSAPLLNTGTGNSLGQLHNPNTAVLFGGSDLDYHAFSGGRFDAGFWFGRDCEWGLDGGGFLTERRFVGVGTASSVTGAPVLARPVVDAVNGQETVELISAPGVATGKVGITSGISIYGWEVSVANRFFTTEALHVDLLLGFRYLHNDEDLGIAAASSLLPNGTATLVGNIVTPPSGVTVLDRFGTVNEFYGGQLGARVDYSSQGLGVALFTKLALGSTSELVDIGGATVTGATGGTRTVVPGGLLALSSNSGRRSHDEFTVVPELGINVGYQITPLLRAFVGYTFLYWSNVARPGEEVNRVVNPALIPTSQSFGTPGGPTQPGFYFQHSDFWAQGVNFGLEFRY